MIYRYRQILIFALVFLLFGCGGGSSESGSAGDGTLTGKFIDSAVSGLRFETATQAGTTDIQGRFTYKPGETVSFYVGDVLIGEAMAKLSMTPLDLVPGASSETDAQVTNILRFIQSLDSNNDPSDGINIIDQARDLVFNGAIDFTQDIPIFATDPNVADYFIALNVAASTNLDLISSDAAQQHFHLTLVAGFAGTYSGSFSGSVTGSWSFTVTDGVINGSITVDGAAAVNVSGTMNIDGSAEISVISGTITFSAMFNLDGSVSGTWTDSANNNSGSFSTQPTGNEGYIPPSQTGSLTLSGADTPHFGTSFTPEYSYSQNPDTPAWVQPLSGTRASSVGVHVASDGSVLSVGFSNYDENDPNTSQPLYVYGLNCLLIGTTTCTALANGVSVDLDAQTVTFTNLVLPAQDTGTSNFQATGELTLNGSLRYITPLVFTAN